MNPDSVFHRWDKVKYESIPIRAAAERCALVDTFDLGRLRQIDTVPFTPPLQKSVRNRASKRLREWPRDANGDFILHLPTSSGASQEN